MTRSLPTREVLAEYGDPAPFLGDDGLPTKLWELKILTGIPLPAPLPLSWDTKQKVTRIRCHLKVAADLSAIFAALHAEELWPLLKDFGGCYAFRSQRKSSKLSRHCWGIAVDLNVRENPFGGVPAMDRRIVDVFGRYDWLWGGTWAWPRADGMHFEKGRHERT